MATSNHPRYLYQKKWDIHRARRATASPTLYRSAEGSLQYLAITRPDIAYAVNKVCQFMSKPCEAHWIEVKKKNSSIGMEPLIMK